MDEVLLKIYTRDSYFYVEQETDKTITISDRNSDKFNTKEKVEFWKNILPLLDGEPTTIELSIVTDSKMIADVKIEKSEKLYLHCLLKIPKVFMGKKTKSYYIKSFIDLALVNEFRFENDSLDIVLNLLSKYGFIFVKEKMFKDSIMENNVFTVNFCVYMPITVISKMTLLK